MNLNLKKKENHLRKKQILEFHDTCNINHGVLASFQFRNFQFQLQTTSQNIPSASKELFTTKFKLVNSFLVSPHIGVSACFS